MPPIPSLEQADAMFTGGKIPSLATGKMGTDLRLFLSAISTDKVWFLCEVWIKESGSSLSVKMKCQDAGKTQAFMSYFKTLIHAI